MFLFLVVAAPACFEQWDTAGLFSCLLLPSPLQPQERHRPHVCRHQQKELLQSPLQETDDHRASVMEETMEQNQQECSQLRFGECVVKLTWLSMHICMTSALLAEFLPRKGDSGIHMT